MSNEKKNREQRDREGTLGAQGASQQPSGSARDSEDDIDTMGRDQS